MNQELPRRLGWLDSSLIVIGIVIGSGIFILPNLIARDLPSGGQILLVWAISGVLSFFGALAYAELGAMIPATGGQYVYLREAYGPLSAFLCGWTFTLAVLCGGTAFLAVTFSMYLGQFVHVGNVISKCIAIALVFVLSAINYIGVREGALVQRIFTLLKIAGLLLLIGSAFLTYNSARVPPIVTHSGFSPANFGVAMVACLMAYNGWTYISFVAGEVRDPEKTLPRALASGMAIVMALYLLANTAYLKLLSIPEISTSERVGAALAQRTLGDNGANIVSIIVLLSIIGAVNGCVLTGARIVFAQSRDRLFFECFGRIHPRFQTPASAIVMQAAWAAVLVITGSYSTLYSYSIIAAWIFYTMSVAAVLVLRRKRPHVSRPYKMWGYPYTLFAFLIVSLWFIVNAFVSQPAPSIAALVIIAVGAPIYWIWRRQPRVAEVTET